MRKPMTVIAVRIAKKTTSAFAAAGRTPMALLEGEAEGDFLRLAVAHGHARRLRAELLVPRLDRVRARRELREGEHAVLAGHGEERVLHDPDVRAHPAVDVALDLDAAGLLEILRV